MRTERDDITSPLLISMKALPRRCAGLIGVFAVVVLVTIAAARLAAPLLAGQRETVEQLASMAIGRRVSIGAIAAGWQGLSPQLILRDVQVLDADDKPALSFSSAYATLDLVGTLFSRHLRLQDLDLVGADIHVVRKADGRISVRGLELRPRAQLKNTRDISLTVRASRVRWEDRRLDVDYQFADVDVAFSSRNGQIRLAAVLNLPPALGGRLIAIVDLKGALRERTTWQGKSYLKAKAVQIAKLPEAFKAYLADGRIAGEVWSDWRAGGIVKNLGNVDLRHASLAGVPTLAATAHADRAGVAAMAATSDVDRLRARFRWRTLEQGWALQVANLKLARAGRSWVSDAADLAYRARARGQATLSGGFSYARAEDSVALLLRTDRLDAGPEDKLAERSPAGALADVRFDARLQDSRIEDYAATGNFRDVRIDATDELPGFAGADGHFRVHQDGGDLDLDTRDLLIAHPRLFADTLPIDYVQGHVRWRRIAGITRIEAPALAFGNPDIKARGRIGLRLSEGSPKINMRLRLSAGDVAHTARYLPVKTMRPETYEWLSQALVAGRLTAGDVVFKGDIADFPFRAPSGSFRARLKLEQGVLDYKPGWPRVTDADAEITFRDRSLAVTSSHARVLNSIVDGATVQVANLREAELRLHTQAHGPLTDAVRYLRRSGLVKAHAFDNLAVAGEGNLDLDIRLPLSDELKARKPTSVNGKAQFQDAGLRIAPGDIRFTEINGGLRFGPKGFHAAGIDARFRGYKTRIDVAPGVDAGTRVTVRGRLSAAALLTGFNHPLLSQIRGASLWRARVDLPALKKPDETFSPAPISVNLTSFLEGMAVRLPSPLTKRAGARRLFSLSTAFGGDDQHPVRLQYGEDISAVGMLKKDIDRLRLARGELRIDRGQATLPKAGVFVKAHVEQFSLSAWQPWLDSMKGISTRAGADDSGTLRGIDASLDHAEWSGSRFEDVRLTAHRDARRWLVTVNSPQVEGHIAAPLDGSSNTPLFANLERLYLTTADQGAKSATVDPRTLPSLRIACKALHINDLAFSDLVLKATRIDNGLRIDELKLAAADFQGQAHGAWQVAAGQQQSRFDAELESSDLGSLLDRWGVISSVREGDTTVEAHLAWPDAPFRLSLQGLNGRVHFRNEQGRLRGINPGAGRLLGLLNTNAIARRLTLDFSDLFRSGFSFDVIKGDLTFADANMHTDNVVIKGPSAEINITGRTGLAARDYDLRVVVTLPIMSTLPLPIAGALLGGPGVGAMVFLAEKLASKLGAGIDKATDIVYTVTGSWNDPQIKRVKPPPQQPRTQENFPYNQR